MPKLTPQQRAKLVRYYYLNRESPTEALRAYGQETGNYAACTPKLIKKWADQLLRTGSLHDAIRSGRPKVSEDAVMEVSLSSTELSRSSFHHDSSIRKVSRATGLAYSTVRNILRKILARYPYRINFFSSIETR